MLRVSPGLTKIQMALMVVGVMGLFLAFVAYALAFPWNAVLGTFTAILVALGIARSLGVSLSFTETEVRITNLTSRHTFLWSDVKAVQLKKPWRIWQTWDSGIPGLAFVIESGRAIVADASINLGDNTRQEMVRLLQDLSAKYGFEMQFSPSEFSRFG